jgi:hypothetical protein
MAKTDLFPITRSGEPEAYARKNAPKNRVAVLTAAKNATDTQLHPRQRGENSRDQAAAARLALNRMTTTSELSE